MNLQIDRIVTLCETLKLVGVSDSYPALASAAVEHEQSFTDFLENVLVAERDFRRSRSASTLVRMAGFPTVKTLEQYDFKFASSAPKRQIEQLASLAFVARKENAVFLGPSKTDSWCTPRYVIVNAILCFGDLMTTDRPRVRNCQTWKVAPAQTATWHPHKPDPHRISPRERPCKPAGRATGSP